MDLKIAQSQNAERLHYRPHLKWMYYGGLIFCALLLLLVVVVSLMISAPLQKIMPLVVFVGIQIGVIFSIIYFVLRPIAFTFVDLFSDRIEISRLGKLEVILFEKIQKVSFSSIPMTGGWFKIDAAGCKSRKFTVVLEQSHLILDAIHKLKPELMNQNKLDSYRKTAIYSSQSWDRLYTKIQSWQIMTLKYILIPLALTMTANLPSGKRYVSYFIATFILNALWGYFVYFIEEIFMGWQTRKALLINPHLKAEHLHFVPKLQKVFFGIYLLGVFYGFLKTLNLI